MADRVAIVIAAGSGMGAEIARTLAGSGYKIGILSSSGKGEKLAHELGGVGITGSNRNPEDLQTLVDRTISEYGGINYVVNSAGHGPKGNVLHLSDDDWHLGLEVYLLNIVRISRIVTPILVNSGGGAIVNISSYVAVEPERAYPTSSVFRAGLAAFAKIYSDQYAASNIRMNNILPGFIDTAPRSEEACSRVPSQRYGRVAEVAKLTEFLLSNGAEYITGQNIRLDGGLTRSF